MSRAWAVLWITAVTPLWGQDLSAAARQFIETHFSAAKQAEAFQQFAKAAEEYEIILKRYPKAVLEIYHKPRQQHLERIRRQRESEAQKSRPAQAVP